MMAFLWATIEFPGVSQGYLTITDAARALDRALAASGVRRLDYPASVDITSPDCAEYDAHAVVTFAFDTEYEKQGDICSQGVDLLRRVLAECEVLAGSTCTTADSDEALVNPLVR
jgi:hypothetical protein